MVNSENVMAPTAQEKAAVVAAFRRAAARKLEAGAVHDGNSRTMPAHASISNKQEVSHAAS